MAEAFEEITRMTARVAVAAMCAAAPAIAQSPQPRAAPASATFADTFRAASAPNGAFDVVETTIPELQSAMEAGTVTSRELVALYLARIRAYDHDGPRLNAMIALNPEALDTAEALDR